MTISARLAGDFTQIFYTAESVPQNLPALTLAPGIRLISMPLRITIAVIALLLAGRPAPLKAGESWAEAMRAGDKPRAEGAEKEYRKALKLAQSPREKAIATTRLGIAVYSLSFTHGPQAAELAGPMFQEAIRLLEEASDTESADFALALEARAVVCDVRGLGSDAKNARHRAGEIRKKLLAPGDAELAAPAGKTTSGSGSASQHDASEPHAEQPAPALDPQAPNAQVKPARPVGTAPVPIFKPEPAYDEQARRMRISGNVMLRIVVDTDGKAKGIGLVRSLGFGLDEQAVRCIATWRFQPGTKDGAPVPVRANVEINFRLL